MGIARSRRLRLLESLRRTISDILHERVDRAAFTRGQGPPENTRAIYTAAQVETPELLDQLLFVHHKASQERGEEASPNPGSQIDENEREAMLSAVRAAVGRSTARFGA